MCLILPAPRRDEILLATGASVLHFNFLDRSLFALHRRRCGTPKSVSHRFTSLPAFRVHSTHKSFNCLQSLQSSVGPAGNSLIAYSFLQYKQVAVSVGAPVVVEVVLGASAVVVDSSVTLKIRSRHGVQKRSMPSATTVSHSCFFLVQPNSVIGCSTSSFQCSEQPLQ